MSFRNTKRYCIRWPGVASALLVLGICANVTSGREVDQASPQEIAKLVAQLSADQFAVRQSAMHRLIEMGEPVIDPIRQALLDGEPEMLIRSMEVLQRIAVSEDSTAAERAQSAILDLTHDANTNVARMAQQTLSGLTGPLQVRALAKLQRLGAQVSGADMLLLDQSATSYTIELGPQWTGTRLDVGLLAQVPDVTELKLIGAQFDDGVIADVSNLPRLVSLKVKDAPITNAALKSLVAATSLAKLELVYCNVTDECLVDLRNIPSLSIVNLFGTQTTESAVKKFVLQSGRPIDWRRGAMLGVRYQLGARPCQLTEIVPDSAAETAGLQVGDLIVGYDEKIIESAEDFRGCVAGNSPGDKVTITVLRAGEKLTKTVELGRFANVEF